MIISHKLKVIYIKIHKAAGTSFEIALSKYCGVNDIITPIMPRDEATRLSLGFLGAQNYIDPKTSKNKFRKHAGASEIKRILPSDVWHNYLKIASIRCPYDTFISSFYFFTLKKERNNGKNLEQFVATNQKTLKSLYGLHEKGKILADFLIRYEHLDEDIRKLETKINCPGLLETFQSVNAKGNRRPKTGTSVCEMYSEYPNAKLIIDKKCLVAADKYEFFSTYWPLYKARLEESLERTVHSTDLKIEKLSIYRKLKSLFGLN